MKPIGERAAWRAVVFSSAVMALALLGDTLLYAVLPAKAEEFGVSLGVVGLLLSVNRLIRLVGYSWVLWLDRVIGTRSMTIAAALLGAATTFAYGLVDGLLVFLIARLLWGLAYAALNVSTLAYATTSAEVAGARVGVGRGIRQIGPTLSLGLGVFVASWIGAQEVFLLLGALTLIALPFALALPELPPDSTALQKGPLLRVPRPLNVHFFLVGLIVDGLLVIALATIFLESGSIEQTTDAAMIAAGLTLAFRRGMEVLTAPLGGWMADRWGAERLLLGVTLGTALGLLLVGSGAPEPGVVLAMGLRPALAAIGPAIIARRHAGARRLELAANETWTDLGAALGPLLGGSLLAVASTDVIFLTSAVILAMGLLIPGMVRAGRAVED